MSLLHVSPDPEVVEDAPHDPPSIAYVARTRPKNMNDLVKVFSHDISREV